MPSSGTAIGTGTSDHIVDQVGHSIIGISNQWGTVLTVCVIVFLVIAALVGIYYWKVRPIIEEKRKLRKQEEDEQLSATVISLTNDVKVMQQNLIDLEERINGILANCAQRANGMTEVLVTVRNLKERVDSLADAISGALDKIFKLAIRDGHNGSKD